VRAHIEYLPERIRESWANSPFTRLLNSMPATAATSQRRAFDLALEIVGRMHRAGVPILAGTDTGIPFIVQGFSLHRELQWLVKAGLTPLEALRSAITRPAEYFGIADATGGVAKGKSADLVLLSADPLQDIANTEKIESVMVAGHYLSRRDLDGMLEKLKS
jgi:imidazolonepropionase-like amidohydrolase